MKSKICVKIKFECMYALHSFDLMLVWCFFMQWKQLKSAAWGHSQKGSSDDEAAG